MGRTTPSSSIALNESETCDRHATRRHDATAKAPTSRKWKIVTRSRWDLPSRVGGTVCSFIESCQSFPKEFLLRTWGMTDEEPALPTLCSMSGRSLSEPDPEAARIAST